MPRVTRLPVREPIRVLVVDDHRLLTDAIERLLATEAGIAVIDAIGSLAEMRSVEEAPDVILTDYELPDGTGAEATRIAKARWPRARVVMLTAARGEATILETVQSGADGYLTKDRVVAEVAGAIRSARAGELLLPGNALSAIAKHLAHDSTPAPLNPRLTARELDVLRHLARGRSLPAIALELGLSGEHRPHPRTGNPAQARRAHATRGGRNRPRTGTHRRAESVTGARTRPACRLAPASRTTAWIRGRAAARWSTYLRLP